MAREVVDFLNDLEVLCAEQEMEGASGLLLEVTNGDFRQVIGPFRKNDTSILEAIVRLRAEEDPEQVLPNEYHIVLLHPIASTYLAHPTYMGQRNDPQMDRCVCGGIRRWHSPVTGCDDCGCEDFRAQ